MRPSEAAVAVAVSEMLSCVVTGWVGTVVVPSLKTAVLTALSERTRCLLLVARFLLFFCEVSVLPSAGLHRQVCVRGWGLVVSLHVCMCVSMSMISVCVCVV